MSFDRAFKITIGEEGGESNHPKDRGGHTYRGVTQRRFSAWLAQGKEPDRDVITMTNAELLSLAYTGYWKAAHADLLNERCGCLHFDAAFNHGPANAIRLLQEACGAEVDGAWGPETEQKSRPDCFDAYLDARERFYLSIIVADPTQKVFRNGWLARLQHLREILA